MKAKDILLMCTFPKIILSCEKKNVFLPCLLHAINLDLISMNSALNQLGAYR